MGKYIVEIVPSAKKEIAAHTRSGNKASIKKLERILWELTQTPYTGTGNPEALKHDLTGYWSRRINKKVRWYIMSGKTGLWFLFYLLKDIIKIEVGNLPGALFEELLQLLD